MRLLLFVMLLFFSSTSFAANKDVFGYPVGKTHHYGAQNPKRTSFIGLKSSGTVNVSLRDYVYKQFIALKKKAAKSGVQLSVVSGYRTLGEQRYLRKREPKLAEKPGYSEHHLGTAVDFYQVTDNSDAFLWLLENAFAAGWAPTYYYRNNNKFYKEPWHWRYVGKKPAQTFKANWQKSIARDIRRLQASLKKNNTEKVIGTVMVNTNCPRCLKLRAGPSTQHEVLDTLPKGESLALLAKQGVWYKVNFAGQTGYVHADYVK